MLYAHRHEVEMAAIEKKISELEQQKIVAIEDNDFALAQEHKTNIGKLNACLEDAKNGKLDVRSASRSRPVYNGWFVIA